MEQYLEKYPPVLNVTQVAEILGCSEKSVRNLIFDKKIVCVRIGKLFKIPKDRLMDYLNTGWEVDNVAN